MINMLNWVASLPLWLATTFLFVVVFFRAQCTFWLGKLSYHGILKTKWEGGDPIKHINQG
ncbi:hypothetical protein ACI3PH_02000 [Lactococcus lactis]